MIQVVITGEDGRPLWVDSCNPSTDELAQLASEYGLHPTSVADCLEPLHLPKHERLGDTTFVIVRVADSEASVDADTFQSMTRKIAVFLSDRFLITVHRKEQPFLEEIRARRGDSHEPAYLQVLTLEILLAAVETFHTPLEQAELKIHALEASALEMKATTATWKELFVTKSRIQTIKRTLWHTKNALQKFVPHSGQNQPLAQDVHERIESLSFLAESLDDDIDNLLNVQLSLASHRTNEVVRVLTVFSVFFLPITFIVGVYGMNFNNMPEIASPYGYAGVWLALIGTVAAIYVWFRRRGWLG